LTVYLVCFLFAADARDPDDAARLHVRISDADFASPVVEQMQLQTDMIG